ncbi:MAG TPA: hypothetical protein VJX16_24455 [Terriglobales bacterium]|nr:hypothetical protein [Terriglobales bacterium]
MKRIIYVLLSGAMMATMLAGLAAAQNQDDKLADYARQRRKEKSAPKKVYDNDNLPRQEHISVVGSERASSSDATKPEKIADSSSSQSSDQKPDQPKDGATSPKPEGTSTDSSDDRQKAKDEWQKKIADQKNALELLQRELDVLQREYRLRAAAMYADAGNRLRNSAQWDKDEKQYKAQIDAKQKAVDAAKQQLADTQEQARKAGTPAKMRE